MARPAPARPYPIPLYGESTLAELMPSVLATLGGRGEPNPLGLTPARRVCVLLIDGLGLSLLKQHGSAAPFLTALMPDEQTLSATFPSTTVTSLASLGTGLAPGAHGMLGYLVAVPGKERLLNGLRWDADIRPESWQPMPTVFERAVSRGVAVSHVSPAAFRTGGLTRAALRGATYVAADSVEQRAAATLFALTADAPSLVYTYFGAVDHAGHLHGCSSAEWRAALSTADRLAESIATGLPGDAVLYVTGDHGMVDVPAPARVDADTVAELGHGVALLGGDSRTRYVYTVDGAAPDVLATWRAILADIAWVLSRDEAVAAGWFGPVTDWALPRIGDVVAACHTNFAVVATKREPLESAVFGMHGSLTAAELDLPLLRHAPAG